MKFHVKYPWLAKTALLPLLFALFSLAGCSRPAPEFTGKMERQEPWDPELVASMSSLPLQDNGRIKPLETFAAFLLYKVHGRRDVQFEVAGKKTTLDPVEWLLDVWCFPNQAADYPLFRIENVSVLDELGIANPGQTLTFQYLTYRQMLQYGEKLGDLARDYDGVEARDRTAVQEHVVQTWRRLLAYHRLHRQLEPLHHDFGLVGDELRAVFGGKPQVSLGELVATAPALRAFIQSVGRDFESPRLGNAMDLLGTLDQVVQQSGGPALFPPPRGSDEWLTLGDPVDTAVRGTLGEGQLAMFTALQSAVAAADAPARQQALLRFRQEVTAAATLRGEFQRIELESYYYRASWHYRALHWFIFAFLLATVSWLLPRNKLIWWGSFVVTALALSMLGTDITLRCVITERPPIKNLYDTFLFIATLGTVTALVVEWILPRRIALALAPLVGGFLIMLARMFEVADGKDTMDPLVAVLDSNYWLATHVTMINTGYAAGLVAAVLANTWIVVRVLRIAHPNDALSKGLIRATYGVTCFSLLFSVVGTIYGGVWANDSWGRFWGWDPKENGALMICLSQIAMLHARWSGLIRDFGTVAWASVTGMVVLFSWFHTNLLGVGLHDYGFSSSLRDGVWTGYTVEVGFLLIGTLDVLLRPSPVRAEAASPLPEPAVSS